MRLTDSIGAFFPAVRAIVAPVVRHAAAADPRVRFIRKVNKTPL